MDFNKALSDFKTLERSVSVKGLSQKDVEADTLIFLIKFTRSNNNLTNLYEELEQDKENIIKFLKEQSVKENEISYNSPNIIDRLSDPYSNNTQATPIHRCCKFTRLHAKYKAWKKYTRKNFNTWKTWYNDKNR